MSTEACEVVQLDQETFADSFNALRQGKPRFSFNGKRFKLGRLLGDGGTKSVYDCRPTNEPLALALPNKVDGPTIAAKKWQKALQEPSATDAIRKLGFMVNTRCEVLPITVNDTPLPAIALTRYQDLPWEVGDHKNRKSSTLGEAVFTDTPTLGSFIEQSRGMAEDAAKLVSHGVMLGGDSFNLGRDTQGLHLFLNDLADADFVDLNEEEAASYAKHASARTIDALLGSLSWEEYGHHRTFFDGDDFHFRHGQAYEQFTNIVMSEAGLSS